MHFTKSNWRGRLEEQVVFSKFVKQREEVKDKGYFDKDIMNAVMMAIALGLYLRNVLETSGNLTLDRLMKFLQSHFVERNMLDLNIANPGPTVICHSIYLQRNEFKTKIGTYY